jgi:hypothetical protein
VFFPKSPDFLTELLDVSINSLMLGAREEGVGGNGASHRFLRRLIKNEITRTSRRKLLDLFKAIYKRHPILSEPAVWDHLKGRETEIRNCLGKPWRTLALGSKFDLKYPRTTSLVTRFEIASQLIAGDFTSGRSLEAIESLKRLPWANTATVQWYLSECDRAPGNAVAASFPLQLLGLLIVLKAFGEEQRKLIENQPGLLTPLISSRDPSTRELVALRTWLDRVQKALGVSSQDAMFKIILRDFGSDNDTRIRQGRKYRSGSETPSIERVRGMVENIRQDLSDEDFWECETLGEFACFLHKGLNRCKIVSQSFPGFDPMNPFNDFDFVTGLSIEEMWPPGS